MNGQLLSLDDLPQRKPPCTDWGWVGPRTGLGVLEKREILHTSARNRTSDRPVRRLVAVVSALWNYTPCTLILWLTVVKLNSMPLWLGQLKRS